MACGLSLQRVELPLLTARLIMRAWTLDDVDAAFGLLGNSLTMGRMRAGRADKHEDARVWVARRIEQQAESGLTMWAVERRDVPGLVGACGLFPHEAGLELGYIIDHRHVGNGYATEAAGAVCAAARDANPDSRVFATIRPDNLASISVAEHVGLRRTAEVADAVGSLLLFELP
jgi:RimJ/RimL family protein N-acetyltransferase